MPTLSIGALAIDPADGSLWVGTGESTSPRTPTLAPASTVSYNDGRVWHGRRHHGISRWRRTRCSGSRSSATASRYAATDNGLFRYSGRDRLKSTEVLGPGGPVDNPPYDQQVTDVAVVPHTAGRTSSPQ